ncbi:TPA: hypothetical protein ENX78_10380 [Candidatus Poribacteria bacterium]|nr:hypothetical protein [Candidatus Poribacteria bacterium]
MKRLIVISSAIVFTIILAIAIIAQAPPGGMPGGPGGGMMMMGGMQSVLTLTMERSLAYLLLEMNVPDEQLPKIRAIYLESWKAYSELNKKLEQVGNDRDAMMGIRAEADKIKEKRIEKLKEILSADDMKKLTEYETKLTERPQRQRQGAGAPQGQPGGGRPQGR